MSAFPHFSNIAPWVTKELDARRQDILKVSNLNAWVRVSSGVGSGCMMLSNPNFQLFAGVGDKVAPSIYGNGTMSGTIGVKWDGISPVNTAGEFWGFRPKPNISGIEVEEGAGSLSRKATFTITAYTRAQLDELCKYYLEPGYTIFLEWGWNTRQGVSMYSPKLNANNVGENQSFVEVNKKRAASAGHYDNYLGFISGGSVSMQGDSWTITVKCTGFTELPGYLAAANNSETRLNTKKQKPVIFKPSEITAENDLGRKRFMMAFNKLPSNKQSTRVSNLINFPIIANPVNFINVDEDVKESINDTTSGFEILGISLNDEEVKSEGKSFEVPSGTHIIGDESFIRFGTLMTIMNTIGAQGFLVGNRLVSISVNTKNTICSSFKNIYSTDKSKLLIPNANSPLFSLAQAATSTEEQNEYAETANCSISYETTVVQFPASIELKGGAAAGKKIQYTDGNIHGINKPAYKWGFLDDLYVNMEFVKGILETQNFSIKDALYQILNGMSGASGGVWDFQIVETTTVGGSSTELSVVDLNFMGDKGAGMTTFYVSGVNSVFLDANFDMDMSGAKMGQIIGKRLGYDLNSNSPSIDGKASKAKDTSGKSAGQQKGLFTDLPDMVLKAIRPLTEKIPTASPQKPADLPPATPVKTTDPIANKAAEGAAAGATGGAEVVDDRAWYEKGYDYVAEKVAVAKEAVKEAGTAIADTVNNLEIVKQFKAYLDKNEAVEKNFQMYMNKIGIYPKVALTKDSTFSGIDLNELTLAPAYNDQLVFQALKAGYDSINAADLNTVSALLPVKFTFTIHGVSGIKRGDKFKVIGIPRQYEENGFFQVTSVKHTIDGMLWKTEVEGGLRLNK